RSAAVALVGRVARDDAVGQRQRLVLDVQAAALQRDARASRQDVAGHAAVHQNQRTPRDVEEWTVVDAAAAGEATWAAGISGVPAHRRVPQRQGVLGHDHAGANDGY